VNNLSNAILLGVNVDHVATIRQARKTRYPDPLEAVYAAEAGGADGITMHLRGDRRHIQDRDIELVQHILLTRLNLEMGVTEEMLSLAERIRPPHCCLVPENRQELTTEGGLDVVTNKAQVKAACDRLAAIDCEASLFIDPDKKQIDATLECGAPAIEIHTGAYADAPNAKVRQQELKKIAEAAQYAKKCGLIVNAGHGLHYQNVQAIAAILEFNELNIGHGIVARSLFIGLEAAVREMKRIMVESRNISLQNKDS